MFYPALSLFYLFIFYFTSFRPYIISNIRTLSLFLGHPFFLSLLERGVDVSKSTLYRGGDKSFLFKALALPFDMDFPDLQRSPSYWG